MLNDLDFKQQLLYDVCVECYDKNELCICENCLDKCTVTQDLINVSRMKLELDRVKKVAV